MVTAGVVLLLVALAGVVMLADPKGSGVRAAPAGTVHRSRATTVATPGVTTAGLHFSQPVVVTPPQTSIQTEVDAKFEAAKPSPSDLAAMAALHPIAATSSAYPAVPPGPRSTAAGYAEAFVTELLGIDYGTTPRSELLAWVASEAATNPSPGFPPAAGDNSLYVTLGNPIPDLTTPSPVPSPTAWVALAATHTVQAPSSVSAQESPAWSEAINAGWEPADPLEQGFVITGTLTTTTPGSPSTTERFSMNLTVGASLFHGGQFGAVSISDWLVS